MNVITGVTIKGFWGTRTLSIKLHPDVNFLIGVNGTGKTTLINMIASALNADLATLDRLAFDKITVRLQSTTSKTKSLIEVSRTPQEGLPFPRIDYSIKEGPSGTPSIYSLDTIEEQLAFRGYHKAFRHPRYSRAKVPRPDLTEHLGRMLNVTWLSIHRSGRTNIAGDDRSYESTVDQKLDELSREFTEYLSSVNRRIEQQTATFQQNAFLSLINQQTQKDLAAVIPTLDLAAERAALVDIFSQFRVEHSTFSPVVEKHFAAVRKARKILLANKPLDIDGAIALITMLRVHLVVQEWGSMITRQEAISERRDTFLATINEMLINKTMSINDRNQFIATAGSKGTFALHQLSSGEKQLFIILGQGLLQQNAPWIYIADEPELSLHVTWQSQLIDSLRKVNPSAQIIVATHSPDIVARYGSRTIDMEAILS